MFCILSLLSFALLLLDVAGTLNSTAAPVYTDYLFAYFTGEGYSDGETISLAITSNNNPLQWTEVHSGKPLLTSTLGTRGVRDPSIIRSHDNTKFWIIATDLKIHGGKGNWDAAVRNGSKSIVIWESSDLKKWAGPRLVKVSNDTAGNTWAPEAVWDESKGEYMVFWSSTLYEPRDTAHKEKSYHRIVKATTKDFFTFSAPEIWVDTKHSVIDATLVWDDSSKRWYRFTKDERANNKESAPNGKFIFQEWSSSLGATKWNMVKDGIGKGAIKQGEGPTVVKSNNVLGKWHMFIDEFGGRGYVPFETTNIASGDWKASTNYNLPMRPRHGSVIPITEAERKVLVNL